MQETQAPPHPDAALVLQRWNAWVRLHWPSTGETAWVNLDEVPGYELLRQLPDPLPRSAGEPQLR